MAERGVNKVILIGRLGNDPEQRRTQSGSLVVNFRIATTESWFDSETRERRDRTEWHRVVMFGKLAEISAEYLRKGSQVYISGRLQTRKWQDRNGHDRYTTEIVANEQVMLGGRSDGSSRGYSSDRSSRGYSSSPGYGSSPESSSQDYSKPKDSFSDVDDLTEDVPW